MNCVLNIRWGENEKAKNKLKSELFTFTVYKYIKPKREMQAGIQK